MVLEGTDPRGGRTRSQGRWSRVPRADQRNPHRKPRRPKSSWRVLVAVPYFVFSMEDVIRTLPRSRSAHGSTTWPHGALIRLRCGFFSKPSGIPWGPIGFQWHAPCGADCSWQSCCVRVACHLSRTLKLPTVASHLVL